MGKIATIARLMIRTGIHSRVFTALLFLVLITVIGLPLTIKGDGTAAGRAQIVIEYTLGSVATLLAITVVWMACGAVSLELTNHQLQLVLTKPVHRFQVWLGKWLGIVAMTGILLLIAGTVVFFMLSHIVRTSHEEQVSSAGRHRAITVTRQSITPQSADVEAQVAERIRAMRKAGAAPQAMTDAQLAYQVRANLRREASTLTPRQSRTWLFTLPHPPRPDQTMLLEFRFASSRVERQPVTVGWQVGSMPERMETTLPETGASLVLPANAIAGDGTVHITAINHQIDPPTTIVFEEESDLKLILQSPGIATNYIQSLLLIFGNLALLAALGLTAGCLFSMPTASFLALFVLLVMNMSGYITEMAQSGIVTQAHAGTAIGLDEYPLVVRFVFNALNVILQPLQQFTPVQHLAENEMTGWPMTLRGLGLYIGVYSVIIGAIGSWLFNRRETALPGR